MKKSLLILLVISANVAFAQRTVSGLVTDKNGEPIENVNISLKNCQSQVVSDAEGKYSILVSENCTKLEFSKAEFKTEIVEITDEQLNVTLTALADVDVFDLSMDELMNMEVSIVSKKKESKFDAPLSSSVVTREEIKNAGVTSIPEALRLLPGVIVREQTNGVYDVHLRGFDYVVNSTLAYSSNSITLVMIDGRPVFRDFQGGTYWESLSVGLSDVERIEIVRGPSSSMYGANAVAGVINIITKRFDAGDKQDEFVSANIQRGNFNTNLYGLAAGFRKGKFSAGVSGNFSERNRFEQMYYDMKRHAYVALIDSVQGRAANTYAFAKDKGQRYPNTALANNLFGINSFLNYQVNEEVNFDISFGLQKSDVQKAYVDVNYTPFTSERSETEYVNLKANIHGLNLQASHLNGYQNTLGVTGWEYNFENTEANAEYELNLLDNKLSIRPGLNYKSTTYNDSLSRRRFGSGLINNNSAELTTFAGMLRLDYQMSKQIRLISSLRLDKYNYPDTKALSYQFGITYKPSENHLFRLVTSRANKGSSIIDNFINFNVKNIIFYENDKNLDLTTIDLYEFGYRGKLSDQMQIDLEVFHQQAVNFTSLAANSKITPVPGKAYSLIQNLSMKPIQTGLTLNLMYVPSKKLHLQSFVTWQKTEIQDFAKNIDKQTETETIDHLWTPEFYYGMIVDYAATENLHFGINFYGFSQTEFSYQASYAAKEIIEEQLLMNVKTSYKVTNNMSVYVNMRNLNLLSQIQNNKIDAQSDRQFGFTDNIKPLILFGLNVDL